MASQASELFTRLTDKRMIAILEEYSRKKNIPLELITFTCAEAATVLSMSERLLRKLMAEKRISYVQAYTRGKVLFTAENLIQYFLSNEKKVYT